MEGGGELLKKIEELEAEHAQLEAEMSRLAVAAAGGGGARGRSRSVSPQRRQARRGAESRPASRLSREGGTRVSNGLPAGIGLSERMCLNILQSLGQSVHIFDLKGRIIYW